MTRLVGFLDLAIPDDDARGQGLREPAQPLDPLPALVLSA